MTYSNAINFGKRLKDLIVIGVAGAIAVAGANLTGIVEQCPEVTVTIVGSTIGLKILLDLVSNWQKHKNDP